MISWHLISQNPSLNSLTGAHPIRTTDRSPNVQVSQPLNRMPSFPSVVSFGPLGDQSSAWIQRSNGCAVRPSSGVLETNPKAVHGTGTARYLGTEKRSGPFCPNRFKQPQTLHGTTPFQPPQTHRQSGLPVPFVVSGMNTARTTWQIHFTKARGETGGRQICGAAHQPRHASPRGKNTAGWGVDPLGRVVARPIRRLGSSTFMSGCEEKEIPECSDGCSGRG